MKREFIRLEEMKELLTLVPTLRDIRLSLQAELKRNADYVNDTDCDVIEGMTFGDFRLSDMPFANTNETSDKTANVALNYEKLISNEAKEAERAIKEIIREIYYIEIVLDKIEIGLNSLGKVQQEILTQRYWENKTWDEIIEYLKTKNVFYSNSNIRRKTKFALKKLNTIALIEMNIYKKVIALININNN